MSFIICCDLPKYIYCMLFRNCLTETLLMILGNVPKLRRQRSSEKVPCVCFSDAAKNETVDGICLNLHRQQVLPSLIHFSWQRESCYSIKNVHAEVKKSTLNVKTSIDRQTCTEIDRY